MSLSEIRASIASIHAFYSSSKKPQAEFVSDENVMFGEWNSALHLWTVGEYLYKYFRTQYALMLSLENDYSFDINQAIRFLNIEKDSIQEMIESAKQDFKRGSWPEGK